MVRELRAENKRLWKVVFIVFCGLATMVVMHELVIFLLVLKNGGPNISIVNAINTASPVITNTVSPTNTNTIGASPIKGEPTMQNAASPTFKQMLEVGLARLPKIPVDARYKARRAADERMILEHMAAQDLIPHWTLTGVSDWTPAEFISRGITEHGTSVQPTKVSPTVQNAVSPTKGLSPTYEQMLEVGLARLPKIPVASPSRLVLDERMILEHMADQGFIHHETPEFISRGITSGPGYERLYQGTMFESALERYKAALERQKAASGRSSTWDRV